MDRGPKRLVREMTIKIMYNNMVLVAINYPHPF